ncbi:MAG: kelch repeat-containing protein, partial [Verrucomicrobiota bacterium]
MTARAKRRWGLWWAVLVFGAATVCEGAGPVEWEGLPSIPDAHGFAGPFAGVIDGALVMAGGANFPEAPPWEGGTKVWHDRVFVLPAGMDAWEESEVRLPKALAYGVSISLPERGSIAMLGGSDGENAPTASALELRLEDGEVRMEALPELPVPLAEGSGVALGNVIFVFSGRTTEGTSRAVYRLDLDAASLAWEAIPWPEGVRGRMYSVAGARNGKLYVFAGRDVMSEKVGEHPEDRMEPHGLDFLRDAYRLDPETLEWERLADLPRGLSAAPSLAVPAGSAHLLVLGGVNVDFLKEQVAARPELNGQGHAHPGFPKTIWAYHVITNTWAEAGEIVDGNFAPVTVPVVP